MTMGHALHIQNKEEFVQVIRLLDKVGGTWHGTGTGDDPVLLLTDTQYNALVEAGVVPSNGKEVNSTALGR
jgi:hypothetical protein